MLDGEIKKDGLKIKTLLEKPFLDDSEWKIYNLKQGKILITGVGRKFLKDSPESIMATIANYKSALKQSEAVKSNYMTDEEAEKWEEIEGSRLFIGKGYNATVFAIGNQIAAKESDNRISLEETIRRMDILKWVMDNSGLPAWIGMPDHYGVAEFFDEEAKKHRSIMFMEQIDCGVNVDDVYQMKNKKAKDYILERIKNNLGVVTDEEVEEIRSSVTEMISKISEAINVARSKTEGNVFSEHKLLPDIRTNPRNILIERLAKPIDGKKFKLWVIDQ